jgi:putative tryptophan/tyrosine transport system substrate-binding protein
MRRREFIAGLGSAAVWPPMARAQRPVVPVIGYLSNVSADSAPEVLTAFRDGLNSLGFVEGRNLAVIYRWADSQNERLPALVSDLVRRRVAVIVAVGTQSVQAADAATTSIPIVFVVGGNPVEGGITPSLNRPAGNITGVTLFDV